MDGDTPDAALDRAIDWFSTDTNVQRQALTRPGQPPASPGTLLEAARIDAELELLLDPSSATQAPALVTAQADWIIRRLPADHTPPGVDSAQQAGRSWGVLITTDSSMLPTAQVLSEVAQRTGLSAAAVQEIATHAKATGAAYNRADLLMPYDHAPDQALVADWKRLVACGPDLPEALARAEDVLDLLTARHTTQPATGTNACAGRDDTRLQAAIQAQPLLAGLSSPPPAPTLAGPHDLPGIDPADLTTVATAAARAEAVEEWAHSAGTSDPRARSVAAAAPWTRAILRLNAALAHLQPSVPAQPVAETHEVTRMVEAIRKLAAATAAVSRTARDPESPKHQRAQPAPPAPPGPGPGVSPTPQTGRRPTR